MTVYNKNKPFNILTAHAAVDPTLRTRPLVVYQGRTPETEDRRKRNEGGQGMEGGKFMAVSVYVEIETGGPGTIGYSYSR